MYDMKYSEIGCCGFQLSREHVRQHHQNMTNYSITILQYVFVHVTLLLYKDFNIN